MLIYGPFAVDGKIEPESNRAFDQTLRQRCADWGYREVADVAAAAAAAGLTLEQRLDMPANNHLMVLRRGGGGELCP